VYTRKGIVGSNPTLSVVNEMNEGESKPTAWLAWMYEFYMSCRGCEH